MVYQVMEITKCTLIMTITVKLAKPVEKEPQLRRNPFRSSPTAIMSFVLTASSP